MTASAVLAAALVCFAAPVFAQPAPDGEPAAQPRPVKPRPATTPQAEPGTPATPGAAPVAPKPKPVVVVPPAKFLEKHEDWLSYMHEAQGSKVCFAAAIPKDTEPKAAKRGPIYFYITNWPKDGIRNEASVSIGYPIKADGSVKVVIGQDEFDFFGRQDKAFIREPANERKLVEAMSSNPVMLVKGVSIRGTETTDQYSLAGLPSAIKRIEQACP